MKNLGIFICSLLISAFSASALFAATSTVILTFELLIG